MILIRVRMRMVPDVTDVPVSPSSVVTELCDVSSCCSDWEFVEPQSFSFSQKRLDSHAGRDEVRRFTSESAPTLKKKNDVAHTTAKFILIIWMGAGALRGGKPDLEGACEIAVASKFVYYIK